MANTITTGGPTGNIIHITDIDADYDVGEYRRLQSIHVHPSATGDYVCIKNVDASGPPLFPQAADDASDETIKYFHGTSAWPYLDVSASTISTPADVEVVLIFCDSNAYL